MKTARAGGGTLGERECLAVGIAGTPAGTVQLGAGSHGADQALVEHNIVSNVREKSLRGVSPHAGQGQEYQDKATHRHGYGWSVTLLIGTNESPYQSPRREQPQITVCVQCLTRVASSDVTVLTFIYLLSQVSFESIALRVLLECDLHATIKLSSRSSIYCFHRGEHQVLLGADCRAVSFASRLVLDNGEPTISNIQTSTLDGKLHIWTSHVLNTSDRRPLFELP
ncbi:hypothetical protein BaRGS_00004856, partial [Batillaria attramentaria]